MRPRYTASHVLLRCNLSEGLERDTCWRVEKKAQMSKTLKWLPQMGIIWNFHFLRLQNECSHGFAESVLMARSCLKLQLWIFFKEVNSSRLLCSKYHPSILTAYSSFPQVILLVQLKHFCSSSLLQLIFWPCYFSIILNIRTVQQPSWVTNKKIRRWLNIQFRVWGGRITLSHSDTLHIFWKENDTFLIVYDSYITAIAFDPSGILLYIKNLFSQITSGRQYENSETLKGISYWDCSWRPKAWDMNHCGKTG